MNWLDITSSRALSYLNPAGAYARKINYSAENARESLVELKTK